MRRHAAAARRPARRTRRRAPPRRRSRRAARRRRTAPPAGSGARIGTGRTRCGASRDSEQPALGQRLVHQPELELLQVAQAAVHQPGGARGGAGGEIIGLDQGHRQPSGRGVQRRAGTGDPASDDEHVEPFAAQPASGPRPAGRGSSRAAAYREREGSTHPSNGIQRPRTRTVTSRDRSRPRAAPTRRPRRDLVRRCSTGSFVGRRHRHLQTLGWGIDQLLLARSASGVRGWSGRPPA